MNLISFGSGIVSFLGWGVYPFSRGVSIFVGNCPPLAGDWFRFGEGAYPLWWGSVPFSWWSAPALVETVLYFCGECIPFTEGVYPDWYGSAPFGGRLCPPPLWGTVPPMALVRECTTEVIPVQNTESRDSGIPTKKIPGFPKIGKNFGIPKNREFRGISRKQMALVCRFYFV